MFSRGDLSGRIGAYRPRRTDLNRPGSVRFYRRGIERARWRNGPTSRRGTAIRVRAGRKRTSAASTVLPGRFT